MMMAPSGIIATDSWSETFRIFSRGRNCRVVQSQQGEVELENSIRAEWTDRYGTSLFLGQAADRPLQPLRLVLEANPAQFADQFRQFVAAFMPRASEVFWHQFH